MAHRSAQIIDAIDAILRSNANLLAKVFKHRVFSLSDMDGEMPTVTVNYGQDSPDETTDINKINSALQVNFGAYCLADNEAEALQALLEFRRQIHISLMADTSLGLSFVWHCSYGGASAPEMSDAERIAGYQQSSWTVHYYMNISDPE